MLEVRRLTRKAEMSYNKDVGTNAKSHQQKFSSHAKKKTSHRQDTQLLQIGVCNVKCVRVD